MAPEKKAGGAVLEHRPPTQIAVPVSWTVRGGPKSSNVTTRRIPLRFAPFNNNLPERGKMTCKHVKPAPRGWRWICCMTVKHWRSRRSWKIWKPPSRCTSRTTTGAGGHAATMARERAALSGSRPRCRPESRTVCGRWKTCTTP